MLKVLGTFVAVLAAIAVGVFLFAPERLPPGIGIQPVPLDVTVSNSMVEQVFGQVLGEERVGVTIANNSAEALANVTIALRSADGTDKKSVHVPRWEPGESKALGSLQGWDVEPGDQLRVTASGYYAVSWNL
jgi:hypothetical protein